MDQMVTDDKLFGCPFCGFRINPGDELCPRCGNSFASGTKFECPFCGDLVTPGMDACPSCHINFAEFQTRVKKTVKTENMDTLLMDIINLEATQVEKEGKKFSCPHCDLLLDGSEEICPRCKTDLTEGAAFQCPICGEFVDSEAAKCSECGANFEDEETISEEDREAADHEAVNSALSDILTAAGHTGPLPELERKPVIVEPPPKPPEPEREVEPEPVPEPAPEPAPEPPPEPEPEPVIVETPTPAPPKKTKQRKLKSKPSGAAGQQTMKQ